MVCSKCGKAVGQGDRFCQNCGAPVDVPVPSAEATTPMSPQSAYGMADTAPDRTELSPVQPVAGNYAQQAAPAAPQVIPAMASSASAVSSSALASASAATSGKENRKLALLIAIVATVTVLVVGGGAFALYRMGQSSVPTVQIADGGSSNSAQSSRKSTPSGTDESTDADKDSSSSQSDSSSSSSSSNGSGSTSKDSSSSSSNSSSTKSKDTESDSSNSSTAKDNAGESSDSQSDGESTTSSEPRTYTNARFQYQVTVPGGYTWNREADNGDGRTFDGPEGVRISAWGKNDVFHHTAQDELDWLKGNLKSGTSITFENVAGPSVYLSYYDTDGSVVYLKEIVGDNTICAVELRYPSTPSSRAVGDPLTESVPSTLRLSGVN